MVYKVNKGAPGSGGVNQRRGFVGSVRGLAVTAAGQVGESFPKCGADLFLCGHHGGLSLVQVEGLLSGVLVVIVRGVDVVRVSGVGGAGHAGSVAAVRGFGVAQVF